MADADPNSVEVLFIQAMQGRGFKKKGLNWRVEREGIVVTLNLQTSAWNQGKRWGRHYLNISCFIRALDAAAEFAGKAPPEYRGHIRGRAGHLLEGPYVDDIPCLDDSVGMGVEDRRQLITSLLDDVVMPAVVQFFSNAGLSSHAGRSGFLVQPAALVWASSQQPG